MCKNERTAVVCDINSCISDRTMQYSCSKITVNKKYVRKVVEVLMIFRIEKYLNFVYSEAYLIETSSF